MTDTLVVDTAQLARWQANADFDYNRDLVDDGMSLSEWLFMHFRHLVAGVFSGISDDALDWVQLLLAVVSVVLIGWLVWKYRRGLFMGGDRTVTDDMADIDDIYGIDFDNALKEALSREDYRQGIRLLYLQTLRALADGRAIDWQPYKTPEQYVREFTASCLSSSPASVAGGLAVASSSTHSSQLVSAFRALTATFMQVRYGNQAATVELFSHEAALQKSLMSPSESANDQQPHSQ